MQGNPHAHALADITSVEKLQGIRVNADTTKFVGDYLQEWIGHVSYRPMNDEWSFEEKDVVVVESGHEVDTPRPVGMYDLILKDGETTLKYTDRCPPRAIIVALGNHKIVKARSLTGGIDNFITVRTSSELEPHLLNDLVLWYVGSPMYNHINKWAKVPEMAERAERHWEDRDQFYSHHKIMLIAGGRQIFSPRGAPEFPMHMLLKNNSKVLDAKRKIDDFEYDDLEEESKRVRYI